MLAVGIPRVVRLRAQGIHPTARGANLPYDPSIDGVGIDERTGVSYYILPLSVPCLAERVNVDRGNLVPLLQPGASGPGSASLDPVAIAGLMNPVSSSWMALRTRVNGEITGKTVLVLGATSKSGRPAVLVAKFLGAKKVVGVARKEEGLKCVEGLDGWVASGDILTGGTGARFSLPNWVGPVHIVLDYVGGNVAAGVLGGAEIEDGEELQYVQVGNLALEMGTGEKHMFETLPGHLISRRRICIRGSGMGSFSKGDLIREMPGLISFLARMKAPFEIASAPISQVASVWRDEDTKGSRLVILP
jgi:NADPH:quinone reductase-like Zn-dependent oxidoreductase